MRRTATAPPEVLVAAERLHAACARDGADLTTAALQLSLHAPRYVWLDARFD